ncbi:hypothetical protein HF086_016726 [Spodoptera exigua]|uniref:Uncharacterized protein n=1 Tax=Spodoptera exigua TaxID=7107 RepID=A0A922MVD3_SPOEX|nr:hypothetical protein HF086_016726 [Spodoptera exigua]
MTWFNLVPTSTYLFEINENLQIEISPLVQVFHAVALEARHTWRMPPLRAGLVEPLHNVATVDLSAVVIEGIRSLQHYFMNYIYSTTNKR